MNIAIHRVIEEGAATHGEAVAVLDGGRSLTYRDLNERGNRVARHLIDRGFKRGSLAVVRMARCADLAVILLAVLKAGGSYAWMDDETQETQENSVWLAGVSIVQRTPDGHQRPLTIDVGTALRAEERSPNLPILTRSTDVACVLNDVDGSPVMLVPHAAIASLRHSRLTGPTTWSGEPGALDLWLALMTGSTVSVAQPVETAA